MRGPMAPSWRWDRKDEMNCLSRNLKPGIIGVVSMQRDMSLLLVLAVVLGGCAIQTQQPSARQRPNKPRPERVVKRPSASRLPAWFTRKLLVKRLAEFSGLSLTGIWSVRILYRNGEDVLVYYLDVQSRQGRLETVAVRETAPVPASGFVTADWRGRWVVVQPAEGHPRWPVRPLEDLSEVWWVSRVPQVLAGLAEIPGKPVRQSQLVQVTYPGHQLELDRGRVVRLIELGSKRSVRIERKGKQLVLTQGQTRVVLSKDGEAGRWRVQSARFEPFGMKKGQAELAGWRRAGTAALEEDPYRKAVAAYRQARKRGAGVGEQVTRLAALFGGWATREIEGR